MKIQHPIMAAFNRGQLPRIACIQKTNLPLGVDFNRLMIVLQKFIDSVFAPIWGVPAKLIKSDTFIPKAWAIVFLDKADVSNALGYHHLTPEGLPLSKIFVESTLRAGQKVSVTASHELAEMLVDPAINLCAIGPEGLIYAYETADAVEEEEFLVDGIAMSDFVYPAFFEGFRKPASVQFDYLKKVRRPFQILKGGYMPVFKNGKWTQIFGSAAKKIRFAKEDRREHRSEYRSSLGS